MDVPEFSEDNSWSTFQAGAKAKVEIALKRLVRAVANGLNYEWMVDRADVGQIVSGITNELRWLVGTDFLRQIIIDELGPGGIGTDERKDGADAG